VSCEVTAWHQGVFGAGRYAMESLIEATRDADFAVLVMTPDDTTESRGAIGGAPRDNVVFELGLFWGALGTTRVLMLCPENDPPVKIPSDLSGITRLRDYNPRRSDGNLLAALNRSAMDAAAAIKRIGPRDDDGGTVRSPAAESADDDRALAEELDRIRRNAMAQGWRIRSKSDTALRLVSPKGKKLTFPIDHDPTTARLELRKFASELRAEGLRINGRVRRPLRSNA